MGRNNVLCSTDVPVGRCPFVRVHAVTRNPEVHNLRRKTTAPWSQIEPRQYLHLSQEVRSTHVAVSCVFKHVRTSSLPVSQSLQASSLSSSFLGGTDTGAVRRAPWTAPSMRDPPKKQTRWSCFGVRRHDLEISQRKARVNHHGLCGRQSNEKPR